MAEKRFRIRVWCTGFRKVPDKQEAHLKISESGAKFFNGIQIKREYYLYPPSGGYKPTGEYRVQIIRYTPEYVNGERISSHDVQYAGHDEGAYAFSVSLTTTAMPKLKLLTRRMVRKKKLTKPPYGIDGYLDATVYGSFYGWKHEPHTNSEGWHEVSTEPESEKYQLIGDYAYLANGLERYKFDCQLEENAAAEWEKYHFIWKGTRLYVKYSEEKKPWIGNCLPADSGVLYEAFQPVIRANFNDFGGSGVDASSFMMTIDRFSVSDQINVAPGTPGLKITPDGFHYKPAENMSVGLHQVEMHVDDFQGNRATAEWSFYIAFDTPKIFNLKPGAGDTVDSPRPLFAAEFKDRGAQGFNPDSFELIIDNREPVTDGARGLLLTENGFSYKPPINLKPGAHSYTVRITDNAGKDTSRSAVFAVELAPINASLGNLPLRNLESIGTVTEKIYVDKSAGLIAKIKDLINQEPQALSAEVGLTIPKVLDHVTRAHILCCEVNFNRMEFSELWDKSIWDIAHMTDDQIRDLDQPIDNEGNIIVEPQGDIDELRANIALLFICLDDAVLHSLTFGEIVRNQPEGTYYR
ncbi:MAG TPA: hypothetical protein ENH01_08400 [Nitrospirae bacterium]|nr:hypothetical protein [Nitrospirota bacterium]